MKAFRVKGRFRMGKEWQTFTKEVVEESEDGAHEKALSIMGSKHRVKRTNIKINEVKEISPDEVEDIVVRDLLEDV